MQIEGPSPHAKPKVADFGSFPLLLNPDKPFEKWLLRLRRPSKAVREAACRASAGGAMLPKSVVRATGNLNATYCTLLAIQLHY